MIKSPPTPPPAAVCMLINFNKNISISYLWKVNDDPTDRKTRKDIRLIHDTMDTINGIDRQSQMDLGNNNRHSQLLMIHPKQSLNLL